jgi:7,8-dihydropterin-6-yl-methyl-4-(beta-D-ribofuranosyl)aminobenzene 5'-phosphate synthase
MIDIGELDSLTVNVLAEDSVVYESPYLAQHGVSFLLEGSSGSEVRYILIDVGQNSQALLYNMSLMEVSPSIIDTIVLTHCHYDHTQGVVKMLEQIGRKDVRVTAHSTIFRPHFITEPRERHVGVQPQDSHVAMERAGARLSLSDEPFRLMPGLITTGEIRRQTDFEEVGIALKTIENGEVKEDLMRDDISIVAKIRGKGLVVITGCSHAGIINILLQAEELTGCNRIDGIIGGFHLVEAPETRILRTMAELAKLKPARIFAGHCTGFRAQVELFNAFRNEFVPLRTGMRLSFSQY